MKASPVDAVLWQLEDLIRQRRFQELETDTLEIKPVPPDAGQWREICKTIDAFLNTRGGILILGVKEERNPLRYALAGWRPEAEGKLKDLLTRFTDRQGHPVDVSESLSPTAMTIRPLLDGQVAVLYVDELPSDRKFVFYEREAYKRVLTGDQRFSAEELDEQEAFQEEATRARELHAVPGVALEDLDLDRLNDYIDQLNRPIKVESLKPDLVSARPFLLRKRFLRDDLATVLGVLVCGTHPGDRLGFRAQVHAYVDVPQEIARDKQDFVDNILPLMEHSHGYLLRNIHVGVSAEQGGTRRPEYPEELLREMVNNALAHRDYLIDQQTILSIRPGQHLSIRNPGRFRRHLLIEAPLHEVPLLRILPESRPRNPKLADVLRVYRKWEGRGIGMATLVNLCLQDEIDLPYYGLRTDAVELYLCAGRLVDEQMERLFQSFDGYIQDRLQGRALSREQQRVLAYLIKSEWANEQVRYTILLTRDNNHFNELHALEQAGLIGRHPLSTATHPIYVPDRVLMTRTFLPQLRERLGESFNDLGELDKRVLDVVYRFQHYSRAGMAPPRQVSMDLWAAGEGRGGSGTIPEYEVLYRKVRSAFKRLETRGFLLRQATERGYLRGFILGDGPTPSA